MHAAAIFCARRRWRRRTRSVCGRSSRRLPPSTDCRGGCAPTTVRVCQLGRGRAVAAGGVVDQAGHFVPERIEAGHPEQNGRHERMHRTLKLELHPAQGLARPAAELDRFRDDYNHVRRTRRWGCRRRPACMSLRRESTRRRFRSRSIRRDAGALGQEPRSFPLEEA